MSLGPTGNTKPQPGTPEARPITAQPYTEPGVSPAQRLQLGWAGKIDELDPVIDGLKKLKKPARRVVTSLKACLAGMNRVELDVRKNVNRNTIGMQGQPVEEQVKTIDKVIDEAGARHLSAFKPALNGVDAAGMKYATQPEVDSLAQEASDALNDFEVSIIDYRRKKMMPVALQDILEGGGKILAELTHTRLAGALESGGLPYTTHQYDGAAAAGDEKAMIAIENAARPFLTKILGASLKELGAMMGVALFLPHDESALARQAAKFVGEARTLLAKFDVAAEKRMPFELQLADKLLLDFSQIFREICGFDVRLMTAGERAQRYLRAGGVGTLTRERFDVKSDWIVRWLRPQNQAALFGRVGEPKPAYQAPAQSTWQQGRK
jgi:hypothetical protein